MNKDGGWLFISHSHLDVEIVRKIRNKFESIGFEPIMFFLKCLNDNEEVDSLIKREINEREWFVYVDSDNSRKSKWVQTELEYIATLENKKFFTIDINGNIDEQVLKIAGQLKIYLSYSKKDAEAARLIKQAFIERDYLVFDSAEDLFSGEYWVNRLAQEIDETAKNGFFVVLLSENSIKSDWVMKEILYATEKNAVIVPISLGEIALPLGFQFRLSKFAQINMDNRPTQNQINSVVERIDSYMNYKKNPFSE